MQSFTLTPALRAVPATSQQGMRPSVTDSVHTSIGRWSWALCPNLNSWAPRIILKQHNPMDKQLAVAPDLQKVLMAHT
jgi:hypothetical protein